MTFDIIALGYRPWTHAESVGVNVRDLHLATQLALQNRVGKLLYISRPVSLAERLIRRTPWRSRGTPLIDDDHFTLHHIEEYANFYALCLKSSAVLAPLIQGRSWWEQALFEQGVQNAITRSIDALALSPDVLLNWVPFASRAGGIATKVKSFDVIDNFANHQRIRSKNDLAKCRDGYKHIAQHYDIITSVSAKASNVFEDEGRRKVTVIGNGVNRNIVNLPFQKPSQLEQLSGPTVGTGGNFFEKFKVDFLIELAKSMPDINFVMIGNILIPSILDSISKVNNIHFFGQKTFNQVLAFYHHFDLGFMFYEMAKENDGDPLKLYEFLATGTPMVSLASMGVSQRDNVIEIVETTEECAHKIRKMISIDREKRRALCHASLKTENFWESKAEQMASIFETALLKKAP
jgi:glycosyltransferase involved in cell wall biosynthesis